MLPRMYVRLRNGVVRGTGLKYMLIMAERALMT